MFTFVPCSCQSSMTAYGPKSPWNHDAALRYFRARLARGGRSGMPKKPKPTDTGTIGRAADMVVDGIAPIAPMLGVHDGTLSDAEILHAQRHRARFGAHVQKSDESTVEDLAQDAALLYLCHAEDLTYLPMFALTRTLTNHYGNSSRSNGRAAEWARREYVKWEASGRARERKPFCLLTYEDMRLDADGAQLRQLADMLASGMKRRAARKELGIANDQKGKAIMRSLMKKLRTYADATRVQ